MAMEAGFIADKHFSHSVERQIKDDGSPVTAADLAINSLFLEEALRRFPRYRVIGEEECGGDEKSDVAWLIDPIDGTKSYAWGVPVGTVLIALTVEGEAQVSVTYDHRERRMYSATKGGGAWLELVNAGRPTPHRLQVSDRTDLSGSYGNISGYGSFVPRSVGYDLHDLLTSDGNGARILDFNAAGYHSAMVAKGDWEFSVMGLRTQHDVAAASLLIPEAGGIVTDLQGNPQRYDREVNGAIMSNGHLHDTLLSAVNDAYTRY